MAVDKQPTPGPWQQHDDAPGYGEAYAATVWGPRGPGHGLVADCRAATGAWDEETLANARLIAAAPDLLAACETFLSLHPKERDDIALEDVIRDAVAKAKGGAA